MAFGSWEFFDDGGQPGFRKLNIQKYILFPYKMTDPVKIKHKGNNIPCMKQPVPTAAVYWEMEKC